MLNTYELKTRIIFKAMACAPVATFVLGSGVSSQDTQRAKVRAPIRGEVPENRVRRVDAGPGWGICEADRIDEEPQTEFVWNRSIYRARKAAKELGS